VVDGFGRAHEIDNLFLADGSVFVSSGGFNPTNTIMSLSLRMAHHIAGARAPGGRSPRHHRRARGPRRHTGRDSPGDRL
jgi:choline dehydrogenase-like flavoprotein